MKPLSTTEIGYCMAQTTDKAWAYVLATKGALETMDQTIDRYKVMCLKLYPVHKGLMMGLPDMLTSVAKDEAKEIQEKIKVEVNI